MVDARPRLLNVEPNGIWHTGLKCFYIGTWGLLKRMVAATNRCHVSQALEKSKPHFLDGLFAYSVVSCFI